MEKLIQTNINHNKLKYQKVKKNKQKHNHTIFLIFIHKISMYIIIYLIYKNIYRLFYIQTIESCTYIKNCINNKNLYIQFNYLIKKYYTPALQQQQFIENYTLYVKFCI